MSRLRWLVLLLGIVLSPLRAVAATSPVLIAYDAAVLPTTTVRVEAGPSLRFEAGGVPSYVYDSAPDTRDGATRPEAANGVGAVHAYDHALNLADRRELSEGAINDAPAAATAAEAVTTRALAAADPGLASDTALTALQGMGAAAPEHDPSATRAAKKLLAGAHRRPSGGHGGHRLGRRGNLPHLLGSDRASCGILGQPQAVEERGRVNDCDWRALRFVRVR